MALQFRNMKLLFVSTLVSTCLGVAQEAPPKQGAPIKENTSAPSPMPWDIESLLMPQEFTPQPQAEAKLQVVQAPPLPANAAPGEAGAEGQQTKRILWIIPNYRAVSADTHLPPQALKEKFWLATQDSFDYSSFLLTGILAGVGQAKNSVPEFRQGGTGFGRYYWHSFADQAVGNYFTEAIVPAATREDPRYYTLGHGGLFRRSGYALSRLLVTRTDSGGSSFNFSEIVGNGAGAGISDLYYPASERTWTKTGQKWLTQVAIDGVFNVFKEFWPDINRTVFGGRY